MTETGQADQKSISYCRCCSCGKILPETEWSGKNDDAVAPCCGLSGISREIWPPPAVLKLLDTISPKDIDHSARLQSSAIFLCFAVELIIENVIANGVKDMPGPEKARLFENGRDLENLIHIFEHISGSPMEKKFESLGIGEFMDAVRLLNDLRGKLALDKDYPARLLEKKSARLVRDNCLRYFALLNNSLYSNEMKNKLESKQTKKVKSVLIVDDELVVLDYMCRIMKRQGFNVLKASTGTEGIKLFREKGADCVLLDVALPDIDGLSVLKEIKEIDPSAVVHMVTGIGGEAIERQAKLLGTSGYIAKPINAGMLIDIVKNN